LKYLIQLILSCALSTSLFGQGNLQFNQVLTFTGSATGNITLDTVPVNKVWKIEAHSSDINQILININGFRYDYNYNGSMNTSPIWLKTGDVLSLTTSPPGPNRHYFFSILEFNIIP
jgi:hypothetical protein